MTQLYVPPWMLPTKPVSKDLLTAPVLQATAITALTEPLPYEILPGRTEQELAEFWAEGLPDSLGG